MEFFIKPSCQFKCRHRYAVSIHNYSIVLIYNMQNNIRIGIIFMVPMGMPIRRFDMDFYIACPQRASNPNHCIVKIRAGISVSYSRIFNY